MENISIDVFGLEKKVSENVNQFLQHVAIKEQKEIALLDVRISKPENSLRADLFYKEGFLKTIPTIELIKFFTGEVSIPGLQEKIILKVERLLETCSHEHNISWERMTIRISKHEGNVQVSLFDANRFIRIIPIKELIKFFN
jgi:hypothetical protein